MNKTAETTARRLAQSLRQFNKSFMQFSRMAVHQNFAGCKQSEVGVLFLLKHAKKPGTHEMKVSEISKLMHVTSPTVTQILKGLEAHGLIERHVDPTDRRSVGIVLSKRGEDIADRAEEAFMVFFQGLADYLGEEESNQLAELLFKASRYFREQEDDEYDFFNKDGGEKE
jgi:DNA-binding MarR family transcriptional regulator